MPPLTPSLVHAHGAVVGAAVGAATGAAVGHSTVSTAYFLSFLRRVPLHVVLAKKQNLRFEVMLISLQPKAIHASMHL